MINSPLFLPLALLSSLGSAQTIREVDNSISMPPTRQVENIDGMPKILEKENIESIPEIPTIFNKNSYALDPSISDVRKKYPRELSIGFDLKTQTLQYAQKGTLKTTQSQGNADNGVDELDIEIYSRSASFAYAILPSLTLGLKFESLVGKASVAYDKYYKQSNETLSIIGDEHSFHGNGLAITTVQTVLDYLHFTVECGYSRITFDAFRQSFSQTKCGALLGVGTNFGRVVFTWNILGWAKTFTLAESGRTSKNITSDPTLTFPIGFHLGYMF